MSVNTLCATSATALHTTGLAVEHLSYISSTHRQLAGYVAHRLWEKYMLRWLSRTMQIQEPAPADTPATAAAEAVLTAAQQFLEHIRAIAVHSSSSSSGNTDSIIDDGDDVDDDLDSSSAAAAAAATYALIAELQSGSSSSGCWPATEDKWLKECVLCPGRTNCNSGSSGSAVSGLPLHASIAVHAALLQVSSSC
jgi:hypothetical protein